MPSPSAQEDTQSHHQQRHKKKKSSTLISRYIPRSFFRFLDFCIPYIPSIICFVWKYIVVIIAIWMFWGPINWVMGTVNSGVRVMRCVHRPVECFWGSGEVRGAKSEWATGGIGWCLGHPVQCIGSLGFSTEEDIKAGTFSSSNSPQFKPTYTYTNPNSNLKSESKSGKPSMHFNCPPNLEEVIFTAPLTTTTVQPLGYELPNLSTNLSLIISTLQSTSLYIPSDSHRPFNTLIHNLQSLLHLIDTLQQEYTDYTTILVLAKQNLYYASLTISQSIFQLVPQFEKTTRHLRGDSTSRYGWKKYTRDAGKILKKIEKGYTKYLEVMAGEMKDVVGRIDGIPKLLKKVERQVEKIQAIGEEWKRSGNLKDLEGKLGGVVSENLKGQLGKIFPIRDYSLRSNFVVGKEETLLDLLLISFKLEKTYIQSQIKGYKELIEDWYMLPHKEEMECWFPKVLEGRGEATEIVKKGMDWIGEVGNWGEGRRRFAKIVKGVEDGEEKDENEDEDEDKEVGRGEKEVC